MKTYAIYTAEGKTVTEVKGTNISANDSSIYIYSGDFVIAIIPFTGRFAVIEVQ